MEHTFSGRRGQQATFVPLLSGARVFKMQNALIGSALFWVYFLFVSSQNSEQWHIFGVSVSKKASIQSALLALLSSCIKIGFVELSGARLCKMQTSYARHTTVVL